VEGVAIEPLPKLRGWLSPVCPTVFMAFSVISTAAHYSLKEREQATIPVNSYTY